MRLLILLISLCLLLPALSLARDDMAENVEEQEAEVEEMEVEMEDPAPEAAPEPEPAPAPPAKRKAPVMVYEQPGRDQLADAGYKRGKGGMGPCLVSCCIGPRIGLEMNEGIRVEPMEIVNVIIPCIMPLRAMSHNGIKGCCAALFIGPRVGMQINHRRIRNVEWGIVVAGCAASLISPFVPTIMLYEESSSSGNTGAYFFVGLNPAMLLSYIPRMYIAYEAYKGKTMSEITYQEGL